MSKVNERADLDVDIREAEDMVAMYKKAGSRSGLEEWRKKQNLPGNSLLW